MTAVARDRVVAAESFRRRVDGRATLLANAPLIVLEVILLFNPITY